MSLLPRIRSSAEDFVVEEIPLYTPCGEGEHTYLWIEKTLRTTEEVARELARVAEVHSRDVGYAGRKDRGAVTRQWFSVRGLDVAGAEDLDLRGARVLEAGLHRNKLRTGHLAGNRFELVVRDVDEGRLATARERLEELSACGMQNRFGNQRFGRDGENAARALALLRGEAAPEAGEANSSKRSRGRARNDRRDQRFLMSALQSAVFNDFLAERELPDSELEVGDVAMVHESGGMFVVEDLPVEAARAASFEISPTGPLFGTKMMTAEGAVGEREAALIERWGIPVAGELVAPRGVRLRGARRPLRVRIDSPSLSSGDSGVAKLTVTLPPGSYATVLLEELFGEFSEGPSSAVS